VPVIRPQPHYRDLAARYFLRIAFLENDMLDTQQLLP
jgi:hypothetical protein